MKIYTKTGDSGTTGLFAGPRVDKDHPRIEAYGSVDELSAVLGLAIAHLSAELQAGAGQVPADPSLAELSEFLCTVQSDLFSIGAELATPEPAKHGMCLITPQRIEALEHTIDRLDAQLPALVNFILPGGSPAAATIQFGRTVCRRAERAVVGLARMADVHDCHLSVVYLNRLSDLLFVIARYINCVAGISETLWSKPSN